jgi:isoquinoline 1-oxidoreductase subunit beta
MVTRRAFLLSAAGAAGVLAIGWTVAHTHGRLVGKTPPATPGSNVALNGWVMIDADDIVTIVMSKAEMGQGIHTGAAMLLADELGADWKRVRVVDAPIDGIYGNHQNIGAALFALRPDDHGVIAEGERALARLIADFAHSMVTGGSTSIADLWQPMREAGASARIMLCRAAAKHWGDTSADACDARNGRIYRASGESIGFGRLVGAASKETLPAHVTLKDCSRFTIIGQRLNRIEAQSKIDGTARFGIDALPDDLLYASVMMCPVPGGRVVSYDDSTLRNMAGVESCKFEPLHGGTGGVAVIAANPFIAMSALCKLKPTWNPDTLPDVNDERIRDTMTNAFDDGTPAHSFYRTGDVAKALAKPPLVDVEYCVPYLAHGALEPVNCTAQVKDGRATIWVSTQIPMAARNAVAKYLNLHDDAVELHQYLIGGGFGRRLEVDYIVQAVEIARHAKGRPVQTIWPRAQDTTHDFYRPACMSRFQGALDAQGKLSAWKNVSVSQSINHAALPRAFGVPKLFAPSCRDITSGEGAFDQPYECANVSIEHKTVELSVPVGNWRSVGHSFHAFFVESFMDEMASAARKDPFQFRLDMLKQPEHKRHADVLRKLIEVSHWHAPPKGDGIARGMAMHESFGSVVAQVAEVERQGKDDFRVLRVYCVIDCGIAINPNLVEQQMESGIVFGLSAAMRQQITLKDGRVQQRYFSEFPLVDMSDCPDIKTIVMESGGKPQGVGEAGTPPIAPAVANALFALTGTRYRKLPFKPAPPPEGDDKWCASVLTGKPLMSIPIPPPRCSGCSAANTN